MLTKVILEFSDGRRKFIQGESAIMWDTFCTQVAIFAETHGLNPPWENIQWEEEGKTSLENEQKNNQKNNSQEESSS